MGVEAKTHFPASASSFLAVLTWPFRAAALPERPKATAVSVDQ